MFNSYEIDKGKIDKPTFFKLPGYFPDATTFYARGTWIAGDVKACYESHENEEGMNLSPSQEEKGTVLFSLTDIFIRQNKQC